MVEGVYSNIPVTGNRYPANMLGKQGEKLGKRQFGTVEIEGDNPKQWVMN